MVIFTFRTVVAGAENGSGALDIFVIASAMPSSNGSLASSIWFSRLLTNFFSTMLDSISWSEVRRRGCSVVVASRVRAVVEVYPYRRLKCGYGALTVVVDVVSAFASAGKFIARLEVRLSARKQTDKFIAPIIHS